MSPPFFSVVIPTFNRATLVGATLESVLAQTYNNWEIVVVDDGSTDDTVAVVESYRAHYGERLRVLTQTNAGSGAARNRGIAAARGRYIALLDSDDLWFPWTLEFYADTLEKHDFPAWLTGAPLIFEDDAAWERALRETPETARVEAFGDFLASCGSWRWFSVSSWVMRRDAIGDKRFWERLDNGEDTDFTLQMGIEPGFVDVQSPATFGYRKHGSSITGDYAGTSKGLELTVAGMELLIENERRGLYPGGAARRRQRWSALSHHLRPALLEFGRRGYRKRAWRAFGRTLGWHLQLGRTRFLLGFVAQNARPERRRAATISIGERGR